MDPLRKPPSAFICENHNQRPSARTFRCVHLGEIPSANICEKPLLRSAAKTSICAHLRELFSANICVNFHLRTSERHLFFIFLRKPQSANHCEPPFRYMLKSVIKRKHPFTKVLHTFSVNLFPEGSSPSLVSLRN